MPNEWEFVDNIVHNDNPQYNNEHHEETKVEYLKKIIKELNTESREFNGGS